MSYASALLLLPCRAPCEVGGQLGKRTEAGRSGGPFPSLWGRLTSSWGLHGQRCGSGCRTPGLERKEAGPAGEAGTGARAGPEAEIHGSGSETGGAVKGPERPSGSKPGEEEKAVWEGGSPRPQTPPPLLHPHPRVGQQDQGGKAKWWERGVPTSGWIYGRSARSPDFPSSVRQESWISHTHTPAEDLGSGVCRNGVGPVRLVSRSEGSRTPHPETRVCARGGAWGSFFWVHASHWTGDTRAPRGGVQGTSGEDGSVSPGHRD